MDFEQLLKPHYDDVVRFARAIAGSTHLGDELLQQSLIRGWKSLSNLNDPSKFKGWLLKIVVNTHKSMHRLRWIKQMVGLETALEIPSAEGLPYEERDVIRKALQALPLVQREALVMYEILGMAVFEIAGHQQVSQSAVKSRLARGRVKLAEQYEKLSNPEVHHARRITQPG